MDALTILAFATPLFGLALTPPAGDSALLAGATPFGEAVAAEAVAAEAPPAAIRASEVEARARLRVAHRAMGIVTWAAMGAAVAIGAVEFVDHYGAGSHDGTRCARGDPLLGEGSCQVPVAHIVAASVTTAAYATTFGLSIAMHDPASSAEGGDGRAARLRMHRTLRWVHLAGMASQVVVGAIFANLDAMGVDPEESYGLLQGLGIYHLVVGTLTWAALTWAGALMIGG